MTTLSTTDCHLLDDALGLLIDAKIAGAPVTDAHLVLLARLQRELHEHAVEQRWEDERDVVFCTGCGGCWGSVR